MKTFLIGIIILVISIPDINSQTDSLKTAKIRFTGLPTLGYNSSFGLQVGAIGMMIFNINRDDTISPPSSLNLMGFYTTNNSWFGLLNQRLYFNQDRWRITWAAGKGNVNFQFYSDEIPGSGGIFIDYSTMALFGFISVSRQIYDRFYGGLSIVGSKLNTTFYLDEIIGNNPESGKSLVGLGIPLAFDSRDNVYNSSKGWDVNLRANLNRKWLGSDLDFSTLSFDANYYLRLNNHGVLANRVTAYTGIGDIPFEGQRVVGGTDIRGYTKGKYRGDKLFSLQSEYRHSFENRLGFVAFAGIAAAINTLGETNNWSGILPGAGTGIRYKAIKERGINIGIDVAAGIQDWGLYFRIGEAF